MPLEDLGPDPGTTPPDFSLPAVNGGNIRLADLLGRPIILVFYRGSW